MLGFILCISLDNKRIPTEQVRKKLSQFQSSIYWKVWVKCQKWMPKIGGWYLVTRLMGEGSFAGRPCESGSRGLPTLLACCHYSASFAHFPCVLEIGSFWRVKCSSFWFLLTFWLASQPDENALKRIPSFHGKRNWLHIVYLSVYRRIIYKFDKR